jgi:hypothetical protein
MLVERLYLGLGNDNFKMIQANTDGITYKVRRTHIEKMNAILDEWKELTKMKLEAVNYKKMIIESVNNYLAIKTNGEIKQKGAYEEITKANIGNNWHKDHSSMIIPHALTKFFVDGIPVEDTIRECSDPFMFYMAEKSKSGMKIYAVGSDGVEVEQQKVTRYYISKRGVSLYKKRPGEDKIMKCNSGYNATIANKHIEKPIQEYDIDYLYYIRECNKKINTIIKTQQTLFD